jgi:predicted ester cyclase
MSVEENKAIVRRYLEEVWGKGDVALQSELLDPNVVDHNPLPNQAPGIEGQRQAVNLFMSAFGNTRMTVDSLVAEGDKVVDHWTWSGTHQGDLMGIAPTGKTVTITGTDISRLVNGKIVEIWHVEDIFGLMQQLGAIPAMPGAQAQTGRSSPAAGRPDMTRPGTGAGTQM